MNTAAQVMEHWRTSLKNSDVLAQASRYELERCAHALWVEIMASDNVAEEIVAAHRSLKTALSLRRMH